MRLPRLFRRKQQFTVMDVPVQVGPGSHSLKIEFVDNKQQSSLRITDKGNILGYQQITKKR